MPGVRLLLEPLRVDHAADMAVVLADPALYTYTGGSAPSEQQLRERYGWQVAGSPDGTEGWHNWVVRRTADGRAVGFVQATHSRHPPGPRRLAGRGRVDRSAPDRRTRGRRGALAVGLGRDCVGTLGQAA